MEQLVMYEYLEINLIGILLLLLMLFYMRKKHAQDSGVSQVFFLRMLLLNALILAADSGIYLTRGHTGAVFTFLSHAACFAYFLPHGWFSYFWVRYVLARLHLCWPPRALQRALLALPAVVNTVAVLLSPWTKWVYALSDTNVYHRGPLLWLNFAAGLVYCVVTSALVLHERRHPTRSREAAEYRTLLLFPLPCVIGNLLQLRFYGLSIVWICAALSMLTLFIDLQHSQLSRDALTGLLNRRQINAQLAWELNHLHTADDLLLVAMMDVDHFKQINDQYGHLAGDQALITVACALRKNCRQTDFLFRFGGDEFLLIGHVENEAEADRILQRLGRALDDANKAHPLPCTLSVSAGYGLFRPGDTVTMDSVLNEADKQMYEAKRKLSADDTAPNDAVHA